MSQETVLPKSFGESSPRAVLLRELRAYVQTAPAHEPLQAERRLAADSGLSYMTVRKVIAELEADGLVYKKPRQGTFVAPRPMPATGVGLGTIIYVNDWTQSNHPYLLRELDGVSNTARDHGLRVQIQPGPHVRRDAEAQLLTEALRPDVRAIVTPHLSERGHAALRAARPDLILVTTGRPLNDPTAICVALDDFAFGRIALSQLAARGLAKALLVYSRRDHMAGAKLACSDSSMELATLSFRLDSEPGSLAKKILNVAADGVAFTDDRVAMRVFEQLRRLDLDYFDAATFVSIANFDEDLLPPGVIRVLSDGYNAGAIAVAAIATRLAGGNYPRGIIRIEPQRIEA